MQNYNISHFPDPVADFFQVNPDTLKRKRNAFNKAEEERKKDPAYVKKREKGKAAKKARRKNRK